MRRKKLRRRACANAMDQRLPSKPEAIEPIEREIMDYRSIFGVAILTAVFFAPESKGQSCEAESVPRPSLLVPAVTIPEVKAESVAPIAIKKSNGAITVSAVRFRKTQFLIRSAAVYGASLADMHQTLRERSYSWWYEKDPLARPFVRLPAPAYYATGLALATSLNWISWKMGRSRKWHRLAAVPQLLAIGGNIYGYKSNRFQ
jgi:hypothetical protein